MTQTIPMSATFVENGLLSPKGKYFPCHHGKHDITCEDIIGANRDYLEDAGWVFLIEGKIWLVNPHKRNWTITKHQYDFLKEYIRVFPDPSSMFYELRVTNTSW